MFRRGEFDEYRQSSLIAGAARRGDVAWQITFRTVLSMVGSVLILMESVIAALIAVSPVMGAKRDREIANLEANLMGKLPEVSFERAVLRERSEVSIHSGRATQVRDNYYCQPVSCSSRAAGWSFGYWEPLVLVARLASVEAQIGWIALAGLGLLAIGILAAIAGLVAFHRSRNAARVARDRRRREHEPQPPEETSPDQAGPRYITRPSLAVIRQSSGGTVWTSGTAVG